MAVGSPPIVGGHTGPQVAEQLGRGPAERPRRGKLDGQREPVEEATDLGDGGVVVGRRSEAWTHRGGAIEEQLDGRVVDAERSDGHCVLPGDPEAMAARRQHDRIGGAGEDRLDQLGDAVEHVLAVVEDEQRPGPTEVLDDPPRQVAPAAVVEAERRRHGADDSPRTADRCQLAPQHTSGEAVGDGDRGVQRQAGLADATRSDERDQPRPAEQLHRRGQLVVTTDERVAGHADRRRAVVSEQLAFDGAERRRRLDAELLDEPVTEVGKGAQALDVTAEPGERAHLQRDRTFAVGLLQRQAWRPRPLPRCRVRRAAAARPGARPRRRAVPPGVRRRSRKSVDPGEVAERRATPQREGGLHVVERGLRRESGAGDQSLEPQGVDIVGRAGEAVARTPR